MTQLEACVLAVIARQGPLTAYQVRMEFEHSLASSWRASTGSIYPLVRRLTKNDLVKVVGAPQDGRGAKLLTATSAGKTAVRRWLQESPAWLGDPTEDPIRTRVHFLSLLAPKERAAALDAMIVASNASLAALQERIDQLEAEQNDIERLVHEGARAMVRARLKWLRTVRRNLRVFER